ncbi:MAG: hypothetical protein Q4P08_01345 [Eubacteriales bacterium]|nr:hypothetical protein [Eubacteriales bacterium]
MVLLYLLLLIAAFLLYNWGGLNPILGLALMLSAAAAMLYYIAKYLFYKLRLYIFKRRKQIKNAVYVSHASGLPLFKDQLLYFYQKDDRLGLESKDLWSQDFAFSDLEKITVMPLKKALTLVDDLPETLPLGPIAAWRFKGALNDLRLRPSSQLIILEVWPEGEKDEAIFLTAELSKRKLRKLFAARGLQAKLQFS